MCHVLGQVFDTRTLAATQSCRDWLVTKCTTATFNGERFITWGTYGRAWSIHSIVAPPARGTEGVSVLEAMHSASIAQVPEGGVPCAVFALPLSRCYWCCLQLLECSTNVPFLRLWWCSATGT